MLAALVGLTVREVIVRRTARDLPPYAVNLAPDKRQELQEKITKFTEEVRRNPQLFSAYVELALAKTDFGDREGAAEVYRTMNQQFPANYLSYQNLGQLYEEAGRYTMAAEQYLLSIQNAPRIPHQYRYLVNLYTYQLKERAGDIPRILQKGLVESPGSVDLMSMMAVYYRDHGNIPEAIRWFEHLLVFDKETTSVITEVKALKAQLPR